MNVTFNVVERGVSGRDTPMDVVDAPLRGTYFHSQAREGVQLTFTRKR